MDFIRVHCTEIQHDLHTRLTNECHNIFVNDNDEDDDAE